MAMQATARGEIRGTANSTTNGCFFDASIVGAGTDYTLRDTPIAIPTDLAQVAASTTLTSAGQAPFTAAMVGNAIYLTGTNITTGWYFITGYTDPGSVTMDRTATPTTNSSGITGRIGGACQCSTTALQAAAVAGVIFWHKTTATPEAPGAITAGTAGTGSKPIKHVGYNSTRGDAPVGVNRPQIAVTGKWSLAGYACLENLIVSGNVVGGIQSGGAWAKNCKYTNTYVGASATAVVAIGLLQCCELSSYCTTWTLDSGYGAVVDSIIKNLGSGACCNNSGFISGCVLTSTGNGVDIGNSGSFYVNNTFYSCAKGVHINSGVTGIISIRNTFANCTTGISQDTAADASNISDYNVFSNCTADYSNVTAGAHDAHTADAHLNTTTFLIDSTSVALKAGGPTSFPGTGQNYAINAGVDQNDYAKASGGFLVAEA